MAVYVLRDTSALIVIATKNGDRHELDKLREEVFVELMRINNSDRLVELKEVIYETLLKLPAFCDCEVISLDTVVLPEMIDMLREHNREILGRKSWVHDEKHVEVHNETKKRHPGDEVSDGAGI